MGSFAEEKASIFSHILMHVQDTFDYNVKQFSGKIRLNYFNDK